MLRDVVTAASFALVASASVFSTSDARACGGYFPAKPSAGTSETASVVTDHRIALALSPTMTTLWDQLEYVGDPEEFAWVLPVRGAVVVGLGNDSFLNALDQATAPEIHAPRRRCARPASDGCGGSGTAGCGASDEAVDWGFDVGYQEDSGIHVTARSVVGPYASVQVHGEDEGSIVGWLRAHKFPVPTEIEPVLGRYVDEGFDFVAVRLRPNKGVRAMVPIRVSWKGNTPSVPLRMAAAGIGDKVAVKLFVIADQRVRTKSFPTFSVDPTGLTWDYGEQRSDYVEIRDAMAAAFGGRAFSLESSLDVHTSTLPTIAAEPPPPQEDAGPSLDAAANDASDDAADAAAVDADPPLYDAGKPPAVDPLASDVEIAFGTYKERRVTRLRAELPSKVLDHDLEIEADDNQAVLDRRIDVDRATSAPTCPASMTVAGEETSAPIRASIAMVLAALGAVLARRGVRRS